MFKKKSNLQWIENDKTRMMTYKKRKASLYKKATEFTTLCGVEACLIVYGPTRPTDDIITEPELWPKDETKVKNIIDKYKDTMSNCCRKDFNIEYFVTDLNKEKDIENRENKYSTWEEKIDKCSKEELFAILVTVDNKLHEVVKRKQRSWSYNINGSTMEQYCIEQRQQQQQELMFPMASTSNNLGQIQMESNVLEMESTLNMFNLGIVNHQHQQQHHQNMFYDYVHGQLMQRQGTSYGIEPVLSQYWFNNYNQIAGYRGPFDPQQSRIEDWENLQKRSV